MMILSETVIIKKFKNGNKRKHPKKVIKFSVRGDGDPNKDLKNSPNGSMVLIPSEHKIYIKSGNIGRENGRWKTVSSV